MVNTLSKSINKTLLVPKKTKLSIKLEKHHRLIKLTREALTCTDTHIGV